MSHSHCRKCRKCHTFFASVVSVPFSFRKCHIVNDTMKTLDTTYISSEKRKALNPQRTEFIFVGYHDGVKGYRVIDLSSDQLIIECSVQFKESFSHVPQQAHADTFSIPPIQDDEHANADSSSYESYDSED
jgi:hypothetical protein